MQGTGTAFEPVSQRLRVLVADDNHDAADSLAFLVRIWKHDARVAYDGETALAIMAAFQPQVAFLDIGMPKRDGYELCRQIRQDNKLSETVLVALTAYSDEDTRGRAQAAGFDYHLVKPAEPAQIQALLNRMGGTAPRIAGSDAGAPRGQAREIDFPTALRKLLPFLSHLGSVSMPARKTSRT